MSQHLTFRASAVNLQEIERIRKAYSFPGNENTVADAIRIALAVTCRQLDSEGRPSPGYVGDVRQPD